MAMRKSGPLDAMVGAKVRMLRVSRGVSQTVLAERIGVTFQQVQKYEQGADRVGTSRLAQIASVLDVSANEFFESSRVARLNIVDLPTVDLGERLKFPSRG